MQPLAVRATVAVVGVTPSIIGTVRIVERIASGEYGEIFLGSQPGLCRDVEVHKLRADLAQQEGAVEAFRRAGEFPAQVVHPNVQLVFDAFSAHGSHYLVSEHIDGRSLDTLLEHAPLSARHTAMFGAALAAGLAELHGRGIVHQNVGPASARVSRWGDVKLCDFSRARWVRDGGHPSEDVASLGRLLVTLAGGEGPSAISRSRADRALWRALRLATSDACEARPSARAFALKLDVLTRGATDSRDDLAALLWRLRSGDGAEPDARAAPDSGRGDRVLRE